MHITRQLRKNQTPWETKVWNAIRNRSLGLKFRRQLKISKYVVDFCCPERKLILELDGGHHSEKYQSTSDLIRQKYLESLGYKVLRFWNNDIDNNLGGVIQQIIENSQPHPIPLPNGRGN